MNIDQDSTFQFVGIGMPAASSRGVTGTYKPFVGGKVITMLDGVDRDLTRPGSRKFVFSVKGGDLWVPPFVGIWPGQPVTVDLPCAFIEPVATPQQRPEVPGTLFFIDAAQSAVVAAGAAAWRVYNPRSVCSVMDWSIEEDEEGCVVDWSLELREVRYGGV